MNTKKLYFYNIITSFLPATKFFKLKVWLLRWCGAKIGRNVRIVSSAKFQISGILEIGENTWIGHEVLIVGGGEVVIGKNCDIAPRVLIVTGTHKINDISKEKIAGEGYCKNISILDGCWICAGVNVLGGTVVNSKTIVTAGSVCTGILEEKAMYGGAPIKLIKRLTKDDQ
ncbi:acyltransferase [Acinetobacter sp. YH12245]|uniref:acyltransferase n=1 Tax=Acinetobacter sp. YH12245 TaxID=2601171 RepID=UPI0015D3F939|nr:acyltransferase [Acinetobacter sp. YH12245]